MTILDLEILELRNLQHVKVAYEKGINILYGENGSGKTSVLEALHLISTGKSFRTNNIAKVIRKDQNEAVIVVNTIGSDRIPLRLGVKRSRSASEARINGKADITQGEMARRLPLLTITPESHRLVESGPNWKRKFIDWGLFHVEQNFYPSWRDYKKCLQQRNMLLSSARRVQSSALFTQLESWDVQLAELGQAIKQYSDDYVNRLQFLVVDILREILGIEDVTLHYKQGWPAHYPNLFNALTGNRQNDLRLGFTEYGIHRSDLLIKIRGEDIKQKVSRGQQKLIIYALNLAQIDLLRIERNIESTLLLDDLVAELDVKNTIRLIELLKDRFTQTIITTANRDLIPDMVIRDAGMFHVEHGCVYKH